MLQRRSGFDAASGWGSIKLAAASTGWPSRCSRSRRTVSLAIPGRQQPVKAGRLAFRLSCTRGCKAYALGCRLDRGRRADQYLRSANARFARAG